MQQGLCLTLKAVQILAQLVRSRGHPYQADDTPAVANIKRNALSFISQAEQLFLRGAQGNDTPARMAETLGFNCRALQVLPKLEALDSEGAPFDCADGLSG